MQGKALLFFSVFYPQRTHCFSTVFLLCCGCFVFYSILSPLCPAICYVSSFFFRFTNARMSFSHGTNDTAICVMCLYVCAFKQMAVATGCDWCFVSIISNSLATRFEFDAHGRYRHCCQWHIKQIGMDAKYRLCHNSAECSLRKKNSRNNMRPFGGHEHTHSSIRVPERNSLLSKDIYPNWCWWTMVCNTLINLIIDFFHGRQITLIVPPICEWRKKKIVSAKPLINNALKKKSVVSVRGHRQTQPLIHEIPH